MAVYGAQNYTTFSGVNLKGSVALRFGNPADAYAGTLSIKGASLEAAREWHFPEKSGTFPIMGTFAIQLAASLSEFFSTAVTVAGIRAEDAVIVQLNTNAANGYNFDNSTGYVLNSVGVRNGALDLYFQNSINTGYVEFIGAYVAVR